MDLAVEIIGVKRLSNASSEGAVSDELFLQKTAPKEVNEANPCCYDRN